MTFKKRLIEAHKKGWRGNLVLDNGNGRQMAMYENPGSHALYIYENGSFLVCIGCIHVLGCCNDPLPTSASVGRVVSKVKKVVTKAKKLITDLFDGRKL